MNLEVIGTVLASFGGASVIVVAFAHFLGKVWPDRIAKQTAAKFNQDLENLKSKNTYILEDFKKRAESNLKDREYFSGISLEVYQDFFKNRANIYLELLKVKNRYISDMHEDFLTEETERWGHAYNATYVNLRKLIIENQLYISNDLESSFHKFRMDSAKYTKEADMVEGYALGSGAESWVADEKKTEVYEKFANETHELLNKVFLQIDKDVSKLRSRIEMDRT